jgi:SulP family sulfate permease
MRQGVREVLEGGGQIRDIGRENIFASKRELVGGVFARLDHAVCARCAARIFEECRSIPRSAD